MHGVIAERGGADLIARAKEIDALDLTLFIPCRNEEGNIGRTLNEAVEALKPYPYTYEIIVTDDASRDGSVAEIEAFMAAHPDVRLVLKRNKRPYGVSYNLTDAAVLGRGRYFQFISGAFQTRREALRNAFDELGTADIVITYMDPDRRSPLRRNLSKAYTKLVNFISGYDLKHYHGTPIFRRIDVVRWHSYRRVGFYADMITRMLDEGVTYVETPTACDERERGRSRALGWRNVISLMVGFSDMLLRRFSKDRIPCRQVPRRGRKPE